MATHPAVSIVDANDRQLELSASGAVPIPALTAAKDTVSIPALTAAKDTVTAECKLLDSATGTYKGLQFNAEAPQVCAQDYMQAIAEGDIPGHVIFEKLGYSNGGTTSETDVWAGASSYVFPTAAAAMRVVSSSTNDTSAGTGAKTVRIWYLKADYSEATTDVVLDGTTPVVTSVSDIFRVQAFRVLNFGSATTTYKAIGAINVYHASEATVYSRIPAGATRARNCVFTVPKGKTLYLTSWSVGSTKAAATGNISTFTLKATYDNKMGALTAGLHFVPHAEINHADGSFLRPFEVPLKFSQYTDVKVSVVSGQSATIVTSAMRGWLE